MSASQEKKISQQEGRPKKILSSPQPFGDWTCICYWCMISLCFEMTFFAHPSQPFTPHVRYIIVNGLEPQSNRGVLALCSRHRGFLLPALGIYPLDAAAVALASNPAEWRADFPPPEPFDWRAEVAFIDAQAADGKIVAVARWILSHRWFRSRRWTSVDYFSSSRCASVVVRGGQVSTVAVSLFVGACDRSGSAAWTLSTWSGGVPPSHCRRTCSRRSSKWRCDETCPSFSTRERFVEAGFKPTSLLTKEPFGIFSFGICSLCDFCGRRRPRHARLRFSGTTASSEPTFIASEVGELHSVLRGASPEVGQTLQRQVLSDDPFVSPLRAKPFAVRGGLERTTA